MPLLLRIGCWGGRWLRGYLGWTFSGQNWYVVYWLIVEGGRASEGRRKGERGWSIINGVIGGWWLGAPADTNAVTSIDALKMNEHS